MDWTAEYGWSKLKMHKRELKYEGEEQEYQYEGNQIQGSSKKRCVP